MQKNLIKIFFKVTEIIYDFLKLFLFVNAICILLTEAKYGLDINFILLLRRGKRLIWIAGSLIWSKTLMELIFNPCGEFRCSPEGPVSQIHSPHHLAGSPRIFSDLLRSVQMIKIEWVAESNGKLRTYSSLVKLQPRFVRLWWKTRLWAELQPWCLNLQ